MNRESREILKVSRESEKGPESQESVRRGFRESQERVQRVYIGSRETSERVQRE